MPSVPLVTRPRPQIKGPPAPLNDLAKRRRARTTDAKPPASYFGSHKNFIALRHDLLTSAAFICLKPSAALILLDFLGYFEESAGYAVSAFDAEKGIRYSFAMCRMNVSRGTFYSSLEALRQKRFLFPHPHAATANGQHQIYCPSTLWKDYRPSQPDLLLLTKFTGRREKSVTQADQVQFPFVTGLNLDDGNTNLHPGEKETASGSIARTLSRILAEKGVPPRPSQQET